MLWNGEGQNKEREKINECFLLFSDCIYILPPSSFALNVTTPAPIQTTTKMIANTVSACPEDAMLRVLKIQQQQKAIK